MNITEALASRYPDLTASQRERLEAEVCKFLAEAIEKGASIGTVSVLADGSLVVGHFAVDGGSPR